LVPGRVTVSHRTRGETRVAAVTAVGTHEEDRRVRVRHSLDAEGICGCGQKSEVSYYESLTLHYFLRSVTVYYPFASLPLSVSRRPTRRAPAERVLWGPVDRLRS